MSFDNTSIFNTLLTTETLQLALINSNISKQGHEEILKITRESTDFINSQFDLKYQLNYQRHSLVTPIYPNDLDDTSVGIHCLWLNKIIRDKYNFRKKNKDDFKYNKLVSATREYIGALKQCYDHGGYYKTWIMNSFTKDKRWTDNDAVVHSNIYSVLKSINSVPDHLDKYFQTKIENYLSRGEVPLSKYYISDTYIMCKIIKCTGSFDMKLLAIDKLDGTVATFIKKIFLCEAKLDCIKTSSKSNILDNLYRQSSIKFRDIIFPSLKIVILTYLRKYKSIEPLYLDSKHGTRTTRLIPLSYYLSVSLSNLISLSNIVLPRGQVSNFYSAEIIKQFNAELLVLDIKQHSKIDKNLEHWIVSESIEWYKSFSKCITILPVEVTEVSKAMLYGWTSYTFLDDVEDGDEKLSNLISLSKTVSDAKITMSKCLLGLSKVYHSMHNELFEYKPDDEDSDELSIFYNHKKLYRSCNGLIYELSQKSIVHAIGAVMSSKLAIFSNSKYSRYQKAMLVKKLKPLIIEYYKYYLSIRQISDDAKDCLDDINNGNKTYISEYLLKKVIGIKNTKTENIDCVAPERLLYNMYIEHVPKLANSIINQLSIKTRSTISEIASVCEIDINKFSYQNNQISKYQESSYLAVIEAEVYLDYIKTTKGI